VTTPVRIQRSRSKGSKLESPNGLPVVCVTRGTKWGNPHKPDHWTVGSLNGQPMTDSFISPEMRRTLSVSAYREDLEKGRLPISVSDVRRELAGKNLACWCKLGDKCHADVLLEVANA